MSKPAATRPLIIWDAFKHWSWFQRVFVVLFLLVLPAGILIVGGRDAGWIGAAAVASIGFVALNVVVYRHGGWQLLGPHFYYDVVRLARRGRSTVLRGLYIIAMFVGLAIVFKQTQFHAGMTANDFARVSERFTFTLFMVQNIAIMVLAPAYLGSAIAEEKERRTLELLFTTHLSNTEIILGKLLARTIHLFGFVLAGVPILCLVQFWGGIDMVLIAGNLLNTVLNILSLGSICLLASVLMRTVTAAVMTSYAVILPMGFCCMFSLRGFPFVLQDSRAGGVGQITVQDLGILCIVHLVIVVGFLSLAIAALREHEPLGAVLPPAPERLDVTHEPVGIARRVPAPLDATAFQVEPVLTTTTHAPPPIIERPRIQRSMEPETEFSIPYTLPPVADNALWWKERFVGGPPWFFSPVVLVPALPFLVTGFLVMAFWFVRSLFLGGAEFRSAIDAWSIVLRFLYYCCLGAYVLGVGFRTAACVARERQQQTLEPLLLLPIDRSEILWAKLYGSLMRGWPWLCLLAANLTFGTLVGAYHPCSTVLLCIAPTTLVLFIAGFGLLLSVTLGTVLRANLVLLVIVILMVAATFVAPYGWGPLSYLEPMAFPLLDAEAVGGRGQLLRKQALHEPMSLGIGAMFVMLTYTVFGAACVAAAFVTFDNRSRSPES